MTTAAAESTINKKHGNSRIPKVLLGAFAILIFGTLVSLVGTVAVSAMTVANMYADWDAEDLPEPERISQQAATQFKTTKIYDRYRQNRAGPVVRPYRAATARMLRWTKFRPT